MAWPLPVLIGFLEDRARSLLIAAAFGANPFISAELAETWCCTFLNDEGVSTGRLTHPVCQGSCGEIRRGACPFRQCHSLRISSRVLASILPSTWRRKMSCGRNAPPRFVWADRFLNFTSSQALSQAGEG